MSKQSLPFLLLPLVLFLAGYVLLGGVDHTKGESANAALEITTAGSATSGKTKIHPENIAARRELFALTVAVPRYCPDVAVRPLAREAIGYKLTYDELLPYNHAVKNWYGKFRRLGSRTDTCENLMRTYGPGAKVELFQIEPH